MRRWLVMVSLAAMVWVFPKPTVAQQNDSGDAAGAKSAQQLIHVDHTQLELGKVMAGDEVVGTFVFHNNGKRPVKILRAKPT